jgi:transmembrane sensor
MKSANQDWLAPAMDIEDKAADLLQQQRYWKQWSESDQTALDQWLEQSASHSVAYWRLVAGMERAERLSALKPRKVGVEYVLNRIKSVLPRAVAAIAIVAITGAVAIYALTFSHEQVFHTSVGGHEQITLADGTRVELNTDTVLRATIAADYRDVSLEHGEAYFQIAHDVKRPFVVNVEGHAITDLGTKFLIRAGAQRLVVQLVEGRAKIEGNMQQMRPQSAILTPGDVVVATTNSMTVSRKPLGQLLEALAWRRGILQFDNATLADAAVEFNRYNAQKLVVVGADVRKLTLTDKLPAKNVGLFVRSVKALFDLHAETRGAEIVLSR